MGKYILLNCTCLSFPWSPLNTVGDVHWVESGRCEKGCSTLWFWAWGMFTLPILWSLHEKVNDRLQFSLWTFPFCSLCRRRQPLRPPTQPIQGQWCRWAFKAKFTSWITLLSRRHWPKKLSNFNFFLEFPPFQSSYHQRIVLQEAQQFLSFSFCTDEDSIFAEPIFYGFLDNEKETSRKGAFCIVMPH